MELISSLKLLFHKKHLLVLNEVYLHKETRQSLKCELERVIYCRHVDFFFFFSLSHSTDQITSAHICTRTIYFWVMRFSFSSRCCCWFVTLDQVHARWIMLPCFFLQKFRSCSLEMICECRCIWQKLDHIIHDAFATLCRHYMWIIKTPLQVWRMTWRWLLWLTCVVTYEALCCLW